jgi:CxxC motif-containing protein (DUF1111 family)
MRKRFGENRRQMRDTRFSVLFLLVGAIFFTVFATRSGLEAQFMARDPGPRGGRIDAGQPVPGLNEMQTEFFLNGQQRFLEVDSVSGRLAGETGRGLGPAYNANQCASCHSQPATGGSSPSRYAFPFVGPNPQVAAANLDGANNTVPAFITEDGPVREARFKYFLGASGVLSSQRDGGVHDVFTIQGRVDATNTGGVDGHLQTCTLSQPDFQQMGELNNLSFRIPTPVFGAGLMENIAEATIEANMAADSSVKRALGISGHPNRNPNDGTISRFGWKAQNKSLQLFAGEAYSVEIGVSNETFPSERGYAPVAPPTNCLFNATPEDATNMEQGLGQTAVPSDVVQFANYMRYLDQPRPACEGAACSGSVQNGRNLFSATGCALCHTPAMQTSPSYYGTALSHATAHLYSDLLVHHMGSGLADDVTQGNAGPDEFRTAPLWGLGQRVFFLHDGRTQNLVEAIHAHSSTGSEANGVVTRFKGLSENEKQDLLNFLRSL